MQKLYILSQTIYLGFPDVLENNEFDAGEIALRTHSLYCIRYWICRVTAVHEV